MRSLCFKIRGGGSRRQDTLSLASLDLGRRPKGGTVIPAVFVTLYRDPTAEAPESALLLIKQRVRNCLRQLFFRSRINEASPSSARSPRPSACCRNLSSPEDWSGVALREPQARALIVAANLAAYRSVYFARRVAFGGAVALVMELLALRHGKLYFRPSALFEVHLERHEREAFFARLFYETADVGLVDEQLTRAERAVRTQATARKTAGTPPPAVVSRRRRAICGRCRATARRLRRRRIRP